MLVDVVNSLARLRAELESITFPLQTPGAPQARATLRSVCGQIDDYVLPRLRNLDSPLVAVVTGPTGSGKSSVVNWLVGEDLSPTGPLRRTTLVPMMLVNTAQVAVMGVAGISPVGATYLVPCDQIPAGLVLVDVPAVDCEDLDGCARSRALMRTADLWILVISAARYGDIGTWNIIRAAALRGTELVVVFNRVPPQDLARLRQDLREILVAADLGESIVFTVAQFPGPGVQAHLSREGADEMVRMRGWLTRLAGDDAARNQIIARSLAGAIRDTLAQVEVIASASDEQIVTAARLREIIGPHLRNAVNRCRTMTSQGDLLAGEILSRWERFVGTGATFRNLESTFTRARDRVAAGYLGRRPPPDIVTEVIERGLADVLFSNLRLACDQTLAQLRSDAAGVCLFAQEDLWAPIVSDHERAAELAHGWHGDVLQFIRDEAGDKRPSAMLLTFGDLGVALTLMISVLAGPISDPSANPAPRAGAQALEVLGAVFTTEVVRRLNARSRKALEDRMDSYFNSAQRRFGAQIQALPLSSDAGSHLRQSSSQARTVFEEWAAS